MVLRRNLWHYRQMALMEHSVSDVPCPSKRSSSSYDKLSLPSKPHHFLQGSLNRSNSLCVGQETSTLMVFWRLYWRSAILFSLRCLVAWPHIPRMTPQERLDSFLSRSSCSLIIFQIAPSRNTYTSWTQQPWTPPPHDANWSTTHNAASLFHNPDKVVAEGDQ